MGVHDMRCPKCGKQSTEYDENKWQCLHCGNKFVYKEESTTYQSQTNVNIQGSSLFDVEPYDSGNERLIEEPHSNRHPLEDDLELKRLKAYRGCGVGCAGFFLFMVLSAAYHQQLPFGGMMLLSVLTLVGIFSTRAVHSKLEKRVSKFNEIGVVGWIALCPYCKEEQSSYYDEEVVPSESKVLQKVQHALTRWSTARLSQLPSASPQPAATAVRDDHTSGPAHCTSCGKQFMLLKGKAHVIKM